MSSRSRHSRRLLHWFSLTRWENYALLAFAAVALLAVVILRKDAGPLTPVAKAQGQDLAPRAVERVALHQRPLKAVPRGSESAWRERHESIKRDAEHTTDVVLLGDSITQGWSYKQRWQEHFPDVTAVNAGIASDRVEHILWRTRDGLFLSSRPKVVVLMAGINNLAMHDPGRIAATQAATIRWIGSRSPSTQILVLGVLPSGASGDHPRRQKIAALNRRLARLANGANVHYLDIGRFFLQTDGSLSKAVSFDYVHLTARGYKIWADAMGPKLRELLREARS